MGAGSNIEWTTHTFNPWWGCQRVSPGCEHCYAETLAKRRGKDVWGPAKTTDRMPTSDGYWKGPLKWDRVAAAAGRRDRVFCASMADVFEDHPQLPPYREALFDLIERTPNLDWQLLTKRPENVIRMVPGEWCAAFPPNVWMGTSVEDQRRAEERVPHLLRAPARVRFLSCEPLLGPVDLSRWLWRPMSTHEIPGWALNDGCTEGRARRDLIHWCIIGGESGPGARPVEAAWIRSLVRQCRRAGVAPFVKQLGAHVHDRNDAGFEGDLETYVDTGEWSRPTSWPHTVWVEDHPNGYREEYQGAPVRVRLRDRKGGDPEQWPLDLRVREFPEPVQPAGGGR